MCAASAVLAVFVSVSACGGAPTSSSAAGLEGRIAELRLRIAGSPRDPELHAALARALLRAGQPGGAIRHFEEARRRDDLAAGDTRALAALYLERGRARTALGEGAAWRDLEAASRLGDQRAAALLPESYFAGALAALRRGDVPGRRAALGLLARAERLAPRDSRLAVRAPAAADLADVGAAGAWLSDGGARRAALETYQAYVMRGGRGADHLRRYLVLHRWWYGTRERPSPALLDELTAERFDLCGLARQPAELGCTGSLVGAADNDPAAAEQIRQLAAVRGWRSADPGAAGAWAQVALRAWLDGQVGSWEAELTARVDLAALLATEVGRASVAPHARATLLRAAGLHHDSRAALDRAMEGAARLAPEARALLVAEAAAQRRDGAVDALLHAGPASPTAWRAALAFARAAEPGGAREAALCDAAPVEIAADHLRRSGELGALAARFPSRAALYALARWYAALRSSPDPRLARGIEALETRWRRLAAGAALPSVLPSALPLGVVDPHRIPPPTGPIPSVLPSAVPLGLVDPHRSPPGGPIPSVPSAVPLGVVDPHRSPPPAGALPSVPSAVPLGVVDPHRSPPPAGALPSVPSALPLGVVDPHRIPPPAGALPSVPSAVPLGVVDPHRSPPPAGALPSVPSAVPLGVVDPHRIPPGGPIPSVLPSALPLGVVDPHRIAPGGALDAGAADGLARVARAYLRDPALADRLASELADGGFALGQRGPLLVELFARLGDPARAWKWAERTCASSPDHAPYLLAAGLAAVGTGDSPRADVFFVRAAGASGDAGATSLTAARALLAAGRALPALTAARRAYDLTAPGEPEHAAAIELAAASLDLLGRGADATALRARLPDGARLAAAAASGTAREPADVLPPPDAESWAAAVAARLAVGLIAPPERAAPALAAVADAFERAGLTELGQAARRERASLLADVPVR